VLYTLSGPVMYVVSRLRSGGARPAPPEPPQEAVP
jgi:hypothetical protein